MRFNLPAALKAIDSYRSGDPRHNILLGIVRDALTALCSPEPVAKSPTTDADSTASADDTAKSPGKPFKVGDRVVWNGVRGVVDYVPEAFGSVRFVWNTEKTKGRLVEFAWIKPSRLAVENAAEGTGEPFHGTFQVLAASLDVELWKAMDIARYARLHSGHPDLEPDRPVGDPDLAEQMAEPDRPAQPEEGANLKPCPFCGGKAKINVGGFGERFVTCADESCAGRFGIGIWFKEEREATAKWNTRVTPQSSGFTAEFMLLVLEYIYSDTRKDWTGEECKRFDVCLDAMIDTLRGGK